uniref:Zinc finger protein 106-like n=1 Tax=Labrus bergylta TaxID=56723 RepID=A0A3Q3N199_9LABR
MKNVICACFICPEMEKKTIPLIAAGRTPTHNRRNKAKSNYCILCRSLYQKHEAHEHMHSMLHHRELETAMGKDTFHDCQACKVSELSFDEYAKHISTSQHNAKLKTLNSKNVSPTPLWNTLGPAVFQQIKERNKLLKFQEKKEIRKKRKKQKQEAGRKHAEMMKGATGKNKGVSKVAKAEKSKQVKNTRILKQMQKTHQGGSNKAFLKNIENKVSSLQRPPHQRPPHQKEATLQNQSERSSSLSGEPAGQTLHQNNVRDQFTQSIQQMSYDVNNPSSKVKMEITQSDRLLNRLKNTQGGTSSMPGQKTWPANSQCGYNYKQLSSESDCDFTSDNLPQNGGLIFDHYESDGSTQAGQDGSNSAKPASENNTAPIRDVDISAMLRHIRRALGVREPCRADREARRQNSEADNRMADLGTMHQIGAEKEQPGGRSNSSQVNSPAPPSGSGIQTCNAAQAKSKQATLGVTQRATQPVEKSSVVEGGSNGALSSGPRESQVAVKSQALVNQHSGQTATSEPNVNITPKVRVARKTASNLTISSAQSKQSWTEMYKEMKWKKLERVKGMPRFGIEVVNQTDRERKTQAEDNDLPLSEGFHWESFPDSPSAAHWTGLPTPPPQDNVANNCHIETQSNLQMQEPLEQPAAGQDGNQTAETVHVKEEPNLEREDVEKRSNSVSNKRKPNVVVHDGASDEQPSRKRKKSKPHKDQDQMDQLLAVSLREEELSHSLQDLDNSLVQARNALQAAYTEVQRLLLFRQQCTAEINSLRAKRIEILQGMQGVYSGASNAAEIATTSSAGAVTVMQPRASPLPTSAAFHTASNQQPLPTNPTSTAGQPHPTPLARQLKQEMCEGLTVSCNPDKPQVPVNQPVHLFPPNLLPSLLLTSPHLAAPTAAFNPLPHLRAESSTSVNTSPESSSRLQGQTAKEGLNDRIEMVNLVEDEEQEVDPEEDTEECLPTKENASSASVVDNKGSESDDSVEMMEPSDMVVIDIDESDSEEAVSNVPVHKDPPQKSVSVEFSSAGTQTNQTNDAERKVQPAVKHTGDPPESVELCDDEKLYLGTFMNHTGSVHGLQIHDGRLYTCSGDNTARAYSLMSKECQVVFEGHTNKVNCLVVASLPNLPVRLYTGSSDQTIRCYSTKTNRCLEQITLSDRVLCLHIAWNILFAGLANGSVASYDLKTLKQLDVFECHGPRGVSCLGTAQEGARRVLLVGSYDSTISVRDAKSGLLLRSLEGHTKTVLCMKVVNDLVFSGSSDTSVHAYNIHTGELVRIYKGHGHAVTSIVILGKVMVTASLDKLVRVYELQSHDRLQVYGGHSDMVMCMAVHKSVIYTGCYDGSVQAVKLNLMKNYRCWWQNCSLIFGLAEHLVQHLVRDHNNPNLQTVKCRWRSCSAFFSTQQSVRQELPEHMKSHVEKDSRVQP